MLTRPTGADADLFQALVENSSDAIAVFDAGAVLRFASRSSDRVLGYAPNERINRTMFDLVHQEDLERFARIFAETLAQPDVAVTAEFRIRHKDGSWRHIEAVAVNRLGEPTIGGIVVNYRDVSERRHAQEALRVSEERLRHLFATAPDIIYYCSPEGRFTYVNPTASRVMKYSESELIGRHFLKLIHDDYKAEAAELYSKQIADQTRNTYYEFPAVTKDGQTIWVGQHVQLVIENGRVVGVQAIARDISKQKDAEERLRRSEARYRSLIQGAAYGIYRTTMDGAILDANPAFVRMLGYDSIDEVRALNMSDIYASQTDRDAIVERVRRGVVDRLSETVLWRRKDGTRITVHLSGRLVDFEDGGRGFEKIAEDVTHQRAIEDHLRQAQKMEAVGRLARGIAHDFNNVLAAILGSSDLLQLALKPDDPSFVEAVEIGKAAERGATLTRQLLAFSRRQATEPQVLDLHAVMRAFDTMLQRLAGEIVLRLHTPGPPPIVRAEPGQIEQVVMNLVVNARDAVPQGGAIDVIADQVEVRGSAMARYPELAAGTYARIAVHDTGAGIDPEIQRHVFEPFFTTKDPARGTGLGLSIVYGIAKDAGGTATFTSTPELGTTFEVLLPVSA